MSTEWNTSHPQIYVFLENYIKNKEFKILALAGDASSRKYFRVLDNHNSYVLMAWEPFDPIQFPFFNVQKYFKLQNIKVPEILTFDSKLGLVLLEDLGDHSLETAFWNAKTEADYILYYEKALIELLKIQHYATKENGPCVAFQYSFDLEKLNWELQHTKKHLFESLLKVSQHDLNLIQIDSIFYDISNRLQKYSKYIQHRDFHSRNIMIKNNETRIIDFQDARLGPIQYDLVSLFKDSYVTLPQSIEEKLLKNYFHEIQHLTKSFPSFEEFIRIYKLQTIQRCLKAAGSFASFYVLRKDTRYLKYLNKTIETVRKAMDEFPEYQSLQLFLQNPEIKNKNFEGFAST